MSWKYIMVKVDDRQIPILFPSELVHADVWKYLRRPFYDAARMGDPSVVSAGFVEGLAVAVSMGESETLDIKSRDEDARIINNHPYEQGRDVPTARITEALILQRTAEMLIARARDIANEIKAEMDG
jgi:hypothetical protein